MPYGNLSEESRRVIMSAAASNHVSDRIILAEDVECSEPDCCDDCCTHGAPDDDPWRTVSIIWEGALDEEWEVRGGYELNIADWLADYFREQHPDDGGAWEILVSDSDGATLYRVSDID